MSILRANGCVTQIEMSLLLNFVNGNVSGKTISWRITTRHSMVSIVAKIRNGVLNSSSGDEWLAVNIVFPGITVNVDKNAPLLLQPHCSFFMERGVDVWAALAADSEELPLNFWATNQRWFDENKFVDVLFGYKEHGWNGILPIVRKGDFEELHYRPTRLFNVSEVGWLTDKVIEFIRMWCDV